MIASLRVSLPPPSNQHRHHQRLCTASSLNLLTKCALTKKGDRFLSNLAAAAATGEPSVSDRLIKKFVASSTKTIALNALSRLLSPETTNPNLSALALPLYLRISEATWFTWNPKLVADLIALLEKQERYEESETLLSESVSKLQFRDRDLTLFYCNLIESQSKHNSERGFDKSFAHLNELVSNSSSVYLKRQAFKSMIGGLCEMGRPSDAEKMIEEMRVKGLKPSLFEFRSVIFGYGNLGLFDYMQRSVRQMESEGLEVDTICSNMVLSSYGAHNELPRMVSWLQNIKTCGIQFSLRTYNSVLNSCPTITKIVEDKKSFPLSVPELIEILNGDEALVVKELVESSVLDEATEWNSMEGKLDLHGMHLTSAYLIMLQWIEEMRSRFNNGNYVIPTEILVVCGSGKHSSVRGESPVRGMVKELMLRTRSPLKIDRKNIGCFVAKGKVVKEWLC